MSIRRILLSVPLTVVVLLSFAFEGAAQFSAPERLAADTPRVTPGGATFTVPASWSISTGKTMVVLEPPEADTHIAIVDSQADDATAAVAAAWAAYRPEVK